MFLKMKFKAKSGGLSMRMKKNAILLNIFKKLSDCSMVFEVAKNERPSEIFVSDGLFLPMILLKT